MLSKTRLILTVLLFLALVYVALPLLGILLLDRALGLPRPLQTPFTPSGVLPIVAGSTLIGYCTWLFHTVGKGTPIPRAPPQKLVTSGPYAYVRNPIVVGHVANLIGLALMLNSTGILIFVLSMFLLANFYLIPKEEEGLERRFGQEYLKYKGSVRRWLPKLSKFEQQPP